MSKFQDFFSSAKDREDKNLQELIPLANFEGDAFRLQNGEYIDLMQFVTKDLAHMSKDGLAYDNSQIASFYRTYQDDFKIIGMNFPKSCKDQKAYFSYKISEEENPLYKRFLTEEYNMLRHLEEHNSEREYYLMIFAKSLDELHVNQARAKHMLEENGLLHPIDNKKKIQIMQKINNKGATFFTSN